MHLSPLPLSSSSTIPNSSTLSTSFSQDASTVIPPIYLAHPIESTTTTLNPSNYSKILAGKLPRSSGPPILYTQSKCICCGGNLAHPRGLKRIKCGVTNCGIIIEKEKIELDLEDLTLQETGGNEGEFNLMRIFSSTGALQEYFSNPSNSISTFYNLLEFRLGGLDQLRIVIERLISDPGITSEGSAWILALLECPLLSSEYTNNTDDRNHMLASIVGLLSQLPNSVHHDILDYYCLNQSSMIVKIERLVSLLTYQISVGVHFKQNWIIKSTARVLSILFAAAEDTGIDLSLFYCSMLDSLDQITLETEFTEWENGHDDFDFNLLGYPFLLSLGLKVRLLKFQAQRQVTQSMRESRSNDYDNEYDYDPSPYLQIYVRRDFLIQDSLRILSECSPTTLKKSLRVSFVNEEGIDFGGPRKEFFLLLVEKLFDLKFGMWEFENGLAWFNKDSFDQEEIYLVGMITGLALFNNLQVDLPLPDLIFELLLKGSTQSVGLKHLKIIKPQLAAGLEVLLEFIGTEEEFSETFNFFFSIQFESYGEVVNQDLVPDGDIIAVTLSNRKAYVQLYAQWILLDSVEAQISNFTEGFFSIVSGNLFNLIRAKELEIIIRGEAKHIEIDDLRISTIYEGDKTRIAEFWESLSTFTELELRAFLSFVTGSSRIPVLGSGEHLLKIVFLGDITAGHTLIPAEKEGRLPTSKTCFSQLNLPNYGNEEMLQEKLKLAIAGSVGFDLK